MNVALLSEPAIHLAYREIGSGRPVVLLHGFCGSSSYWDELIPLLDGQCRLLVPDLPGHGQSSLPPASFSIEAYADTISQLLAQKGIEQAVWLGHSLGGYITLAAAERQPERVSAFGLVHSTAFPDDPSGKEGRLKAIQTIQQSGIDAFVDGLVPKLFAPGGVDKHPQWVTRTKQIGYGTNPQGAIRALEAMRERPDRRHVLEGTTTPVLLVAGSADQIISSDKTFTVSGDLIRHRLIAGAGHMSMLEAPAQLAAEISVFLDSLDK